MENTPHIFLSGEPAEQFAKQQGHVLVDNTTFTTQQRKEQWQKYKDEHKLAAHDEIVQRVTTHTQTVGAVAVDCQGRLAAATSTGGRTNKWDGRIGDTPMIGAGRLFMTVLLGLLHSTSQECCCTDAALASWQLTEIC